jgi:alanyl-tRNA synthetase
MNSQLLYQQDVTVLEFEAQVVELLSLPDGRKGAVLNQTYFYPTGGGQEHDTGRLSSTRVVDVFKDDANSCTVHVVEGEVGLGPVKASIDAERRLRAMQHHTAQHLLTQCLLRQTGYETVSANINGYSTSTLDITTTQLNQSDLDQAELMANRIIYEDRVVKTYIVTPQELQSIPLRRPPKVSENIRIVEIDGYDYSPCGGTHVLRTGSIGLVKVIKAERQNDRLRVHFMAGLQAMELFSRMYDSNINLANRMSVSWQDIPEVVGKQTDQLAAIQKELQSFREASIRYEARELEMKAEPQKGLRLVRAGFEGRPISELRLLAEQLKKVTDLISFLASYDGQKVSLIVTCGDHTSMDARQLLAINLAKIGGRGGGDATLAQGGAVVGELPYRLFFQQIELEQPQSES